MRVTSFVIFNPLAKIRGFTKIMTKIELMPHSDKNKNLKVKPSTSGEGKNCTKSESKILEYAWRTQNSRLFDT